MTSLTPYTTSTSAMGQLLVPAGFPKAGGYPDEIFTDLTEDQRKGFQCNICFLVLRDARKCPNGHMFCAGCVFTWMVSSNCARSKCPVCRDPGTYRPDLTRDNALASRTVKCTTSGCIWTGRLKDYTQHEQSHVQIHPLSRNKTRGNESRGFLPTITPGLLLGGSLTPTRNILVGSSPGAEGTTSSRLSYEEMLLERRVLRDRRRLGHLFETFSDHLERRRRGISAAYREREQLRLEAMAEVENLGRRLEEVSSDLSHLADNMSRDNDRYNGYIESSQHLESSLANVSDLVDQTTNAAANSLSPPLINIASSLPIGSNTTQLLHSNRERSNLSPTVSFGVSPIVITEPATGQSTIQPRRRVQVNRTPRNTKNPLYRSQKHR